MGFLSTVDVAIFHNKHSLSMQYRYHATKKNGEECVPNILFVHQPSTKTKVFPVTSMGLQLPLT
jgi:hypothetical protein